MSEKQIMIEQERHTEKEVYSYHTFLFPFVWKKDCCEKEKQRFLDFLDNPKESYWEKYTHPVLSPYALVVHCGGCMLTRRAVQARISRCREAGVPIVNYGIAIAACHGIHASPDTCMVVRQPSL